MLRELITGAALVTYTALASPGCIKQNQIKKPEKSLEIKVQPRPKKHKFAVMLIDMQPCFLRRIADKEKKEEIPYIIEVLRFAAKNDIPAAVIEYESCKGTIDRLKKEVKRIPRHRYFYKVMADGFTNPELPKQLRKWNAEYVLLMGINASQCVMVTALGALRHKFKIATSKQLIADADFLDDLKESIDVYKDIGQLYFDNFRELYKFME